MTLNKLYECDYDAQNKATKEDPRDGNPNRPSNIHRAGKLCFPTKPTDEADLLRNALKPWVRPPRSKTERLYLYHRRTGDGAFAIQKQARVKVEKDDEPEVSA